MPGDSLNLPPPAIKALGFLRAEFSIFAGSEPDPRIDARARRGHDTVLNPGAIMAGREILPPSLADLEALATEALKTIPELLRRQVRDVVIQVQDFPDEETEQEMGLESPFDLLGLYRGVDLTRQSVSDVRTSPDMIFLYRRPLLDYWCDTGEDLIHVVRHVLIHEIGHHFGLSDDDMEAIEESLPD
jgi:predicted Zn-dependent protease with MMP-like domain